MYSDSMRQYLMEFDIVCLLETWSTIDKPPEMQKLKFIGGCNAIKRKSAPKGRKSGGLMVFARDSINSKVTVLSENESVNCVFLRINNTLLVFAYRPPDSSPYKIENFFDKLEENIQRLQCANPDVNNIIIMGDLNARVGSEPDFICVENLDNQRIEEETRRNRDNVVNNEGKMLLNFCKANGLRILNGRSGNDLDGNFTFIGRQGSSTIDFGIVSEYLLDQVSDFRVGARIESTHFPIELAIKRGGMEPRTKIVRSVNQPLPKRYAWKEDRKGEVESLATRYMVWLESKSLVNSESIGVEKQASLLEHYFKRIFKPLKKQASRPSQVGSDGNSTDLLQLESEAKSALVNLRGNNSKANIRMYLQKQREWNVGKAIAAEKKRKEKESIINELYQNNDSKNLWRKVKAITENKSGFSLPNSISDLSLIHI